MYLKNLLLTNFKNYSQAEISLSPDINCFVGANGTGKTNLLDAIYYLCFCKSYFNSIDSQNINYNKDFFTIEGLFVRNRDKTDTVLCIQKRNERKLFKLNKKEYERLSDHIGLFPLVIISPSDSNMIYNGSEDRRKYLDGVISQFDKEYLHSLINYNKILEHRNALLKQQNFNNTNPEVFEIWDEQLIKYGELINNKRKLFFQKYEPFFQLYYKFINKNKEELRIEYESQLNQNNFKQLLNSSLNKDIQYQYTTTGIHKDDLLFKIGNFPLKKFGSQGQQKSFLIAMKLAQFDFTKSIIGYKPILLFDDLFDKLDDMRIEELIKLVSGENFGQIIITETHSERIFKIFRDTGINNKIYSIDNSQINSVNNI